MLSDHEYFGTDMATFNSDSEGVYITSGYLYGIAEAQYNREYGDITRGRAIAIITHDKSYLKAKYEESLKELV